MSKREERAIQEEEDRQATPSRNKILKNREKQHIQQ